MRKAIIGYMFSLFVVMLLAMATYSAFAVFRGVTYMVLPAVLSLVASAYFAWFIGDMCYVYGEEDDEQ